MLEQHYQARISSTLATRLAYVQRRADHVAVTLQNGAGRIVDHGDRMVVDGRSTHVHDDAIRALVDLAKARGWKNITPTGSREFQSRLAVVAAAEGLNVKPQQPTEAQAPARPIRAEASQSQADIVRQERERLARARSNRHISAPKPRPR